MSDKLSATENTVRLLSRKNKAYLAALESAGLAKTVMRRWSSETCLNRNSSSLVNPHHGSMENLDVFAGGDHQGV